MTLAPPRRSFKEHMHLAREEAILHATCQLLGAKAFDAMTVDAVAQAVHQTAQRMGLSDQAVSVAKASRYKHFSREDELCSAAMVQVLRRVRAYLDTLDSAMAPIDKLRSVVRWSLQSLLAQEMPLLPSRNSSLRAVLMANKDYLDGLVTVSDQIGQWITEAQRQGTIDATLAPLVVLYTLFARACDPVVGFLKDSGQYQDDEIVDLVLRTCFDGLRAR